MLVWLASFPRSGNTLVRVILKSLYYRRSTCSDDGRDSYVSYTHFVKQLDPGRHAETSVLFLHYLIGWLIIHRLCWT